MDGRFGLLDNVVGGTWPLIGLDTDPSENILDDDLHWFRGIGGTVRHVGENGPIADVDGTYRRWFEAFACTVVIARPDF